MLKKWIFVSILATGVAFATTGCGSDEPANNNGISTGNNGNNGVVDGGLSDANDGADDTGPASDASDATDASDPSDAGDTGDSGTAGEDTGDGSVAACMEGDCEAGFICVEGSCVSETAEAKCAAADDLGMLQMDTPKNVTGTLLDQSDILTTTCAQDQGGEKVYKFTVAEDSQVTFDATWTGQFDGLLDFRQGDCASGSTSAQMCFDIEEESFIAESGTDYYMVVEHTVGRADAFDITLEATPVACIPGEQSCSSGSLQRCVGTGQLQSFLCADDCTTSSSGTETCAGNICSEAIEVVGAGVYSGDINAYSSDYDFGQISGCDVGGTAVSTPGAEVVFKLSGLPAGQEVKIDADTDDQNNNAIFITSDCGQPVNLTCEAAYLSNENPTWTVPAGGGDFYIFIDKTSNTGDTFRYSVELVQ